MLTRTLFLPSVRPTMMKAFLDSLDYLPGWDLLCAFQCYEKKDWDLLKQSHNFHRITDYVEYPERRFPYPTRIEMYKRWYTKYDVWCSVDDDMQYLPTVNYEIMQKKVCEPGVAVVSGNWVKHESFLKRIKPVDEFVQQPLTNMSGGQMFTRKVIDILLNSPVEPFLFCDIQVPLYAYLQGYINFRYRGSLIIHRIMQKDGLHRTFQQHTMAMPDPKYIIAHPCTKVYETDNNWYMPASKDLTPLSKLSHNKNTEQAYAKDINKYAYLLS